MIVRGCVKAEYTEVIIRLNPLETDLVVDGWMVGRKEEEEVLKGNGISCGCFQRIPLSQLHLKS